MTFVQTTGEISQHKHGVAKSALRPQDITYILLHGFKQKSQVHHPVLLFLQIVDTKTHFFPFMPFSPLSTLKGIDQYPSPNPHLKNPREKDENT